MAKKVSLTLDEIFTTCIGDAYNLSKNITDPKDRAEVCISIANVIQNSGLMTNDSGKEIASNEETSKQDLESKPKPAEAKKEEPVVEDESWNNPDLVEKYKEESDFIESINAADKAMGTELLKGFLTEFSSGAFDDVASIQPSNIVAITTFIKNQLMPYYAAITDLVKENGEEIVVTNIATNLEHYSGITSIDQLTLIDYFHVYSIFIEQ